jgi:drug/metabolite transporter (DMT)-like permease
LVVVVAFSQVVGLLFAALLTLSGAAGDAPALHYMWPAAAGGIAGVLALGAFYRGLAIGTMSIVAPIAATGAMVPVVVGLAQGDRPGILRGVGIVCAIVGVVLASREHPDSVSGPAARHSILLALTAAVGFGCFFVGFNESASHGPLWTTLTARIAALPVLLVWIAAARPGRGSIDSRALIALVTIGLFDVGANILFAYATTHGLLSLVAVVGSLYPVATILLARALLGERVRRVQEVGIVAALTGVALIAAG